MEKLTVRQATAYIQEKYGQPRHDISKLVKACRMTAKAAKLKPASIFFLMIENQPIAEAYTHSYGFQTATGRHLINTTSNTYHSL